MKANACKIGNRKWKYLQAYFDILLLETAIRSARENKEILLFPLERKSESSNFLLIFGTEKFRNAYAFGWKKFQARLEKYYNSFKARYESYYFFISCSTIFNVLSYII